MQHLLTAYSLYVESILAFTAGLACVLVWPLRRVLVERERGRRAPT